MHRHYIRKQPIDLAELRNKVHIIQSSRWGRSFKTDAKGTDVSPWECRRPRRLRFTKSRRGRRRSRGGIRRVTSDPAAPFKTS
jgi:hypothetical protein